MIMIIVAHGFVAHGFVAHGFFAHGFVAHSFYGREIFENRLKIKKNILHENRFKIAFVVNPKKYRFNQNKTNRTA